MLKASIQTLCKKNGIEYLTLIHWIMADDNIKEIFDKASSLMRRSKSLKFEKTLYDTLIHEIRNGGCEILTVKKKGNLVLNVLKEK